MNELYELVDDHISEYENGTITLSGDIPFSMQHTVKHYVRCSPHRDRKRATLGVG